MAGYGKNDVEVTSGAYGKGDKPAESQEPGYFMPGSKSEALLRGFSQAATLGFGDELQAYLRPGNTEQLKAQERAANAAAAATNPKSYIAGSVIGAAPQAMGIANFSRLAASLPGAVGRGAAAGTVTGAVQGAGSAENMGDIPRQAAIQGAVGAATGALTGGITGQAQKMSQGSLASRLKGVTENTASPPPATTLGTFANQLSLPGIGALGGMGYRNVQSDNAIDWQSDAPGALAETAIAGAQGAALGLGAKYGTALGGKAAEALAKRAVGGFTKAGEGVAKGAISGKDLALGLPGSVAEKVAKSPFSKLSDYMSLTAGTNNPEVEAAAQAADAAGDDPDQRRKIAMQLNSTATGRAVGNMDSPVRNLK